MIPHLEELLASSKVVPAVNQVELSPFLYTRGLIEYCREHGIAVEAYSPLGTGRHLTSPVVKRLASRAGRTPVQVLLRWCLQRGLVVITKSTHRDRIAENAGVFDFTLSDPDMAELDALDETNGTERAVEGKWW